MVNEAALRGTEGTRLGFEDGIVDNLPARDSETIRIKRPLCGG